MNNDLLHSRRRVAEAVLADIATGTVIPHRFTETAQWWWNRGISFELADFAALLQELHDRTEAGIVVEPQRWAYEGNSVIVEAVSSSRLKDGRIYSNRYVFIIEFDGYLISLVKEYSDTQHVAEVFGLGSEA